MKPKRGKMKHVTKLEDLWEMIPSMKCIEGCAECCKQPSISYLERKKILEWLKNRGRKELKAKSPADPCPYIKRGRCSIYEVRPIPCRLFGVVETVKCPYGCGPTRYLTESEAKEIIMVLADLNEKSLNLKLKK